MRLRIAAYSPFKGLDASSLTWLFVAALMLFCLLLPSSSYVAALPFIQSEWGLSNTQAGALYSAYLAGYAFSALFIIPMTDRIGSRHILLVSTVVSAASHLLFPLVAKDLWAAAGLRLLAGVGLVGVYTPGMRIVAERFAERGRGMAVGIFVTAFYASASVSLAATGVLMRWFEWRWAYVVMAAVSVVAFPLAYGLLRRHRYPRTTRASGRLDLAVLKNRVTRLYILGYSLHAAELYVVRVWLPLFLVAALVARGVDGAQAAATAATVGGLALAVGAMGPVMGGIMSDKFGRAASASAIFGLSGACAFAIGWMGGFPWPVIVALAVVYGWAIGADSAIYSTAVTEAAEQPSLGSTMAVHSFLGFMGGVAGPVIFGGILDVAPDAIRWGLGFTFVGTLSLIAIAGLSRVSVKAPGAEFARPTGGDGATRGTTRDEVT